MISLVLKRVQLEDAMNWLSTIGGAYSALGDYFISFVSKFFCRFVYYTSVGNRVHHL